ncbi:MAG: response regulator [Armatimonadota bacterium]
MAPPPSFTLAPQLRRAVLAPGFALAAATITHLLASHWQPAPASFFFLAVFLSAWWGGFVPGVVCGFVSVAVMDLLFIPPLGRIEIGLATGVRMAIFTLTALLISSLTEARRRGEAELRNQARLALLTAEIGQTVTERSALPMMLHRSGEILSAGLSTELFRIWLYHPGEQLLQLQVEFRGSHARRPASLQVSLGELTVGRIAEAGRKLVTSTVPADPSVADEELLQLPGERTFICQPLLVEDRLVGVCSLLVSAPVSDAMLHALDSAAHQLALGIEAHRFSAQLVKQAERLELALARAEEASRFKSEFLATVSHELRTPLNGVIAAAGLLLDTPLPPAQRHLAEIMHQSGEALLTVINDTLDFSKVEAGRLEIEPVPFDLLSVVEQVGDLTASRADQKGVDLVVRYAPEVPRFVVGDAGRIRQILLNLVDNAIKFTERGHVLVNVEGLATEEQAQLVIGVEDTGIGIAEAAQERIFEQFSQADRTTTRRFGGTGLGLTISRELAVLMGGTLSVTSRPGRGSTFWLSLRLPLDRGAWPPSLPSSGLQGRLVLAALDGEIARRTLREQLESWGARVVDCGTAGEVLRQLKDCVRSESPPAAVLLDGDLPDLDLQEIRRWREDPRLRGIRVVIFCQSAILPHLAGEHDARYLVRPVHTDELRKTLSDAEAPDAETREPEQAETLRDASEAADPGAHSAPAISAAGRALVAEDNRCSQSLARLILEQAGFRVDLVSTGREAVERARRTAYDLIVMDCRMPEMDGFTAAREIRKREPAGEHVPILAVTASASPADRERCLSAGMDDFLTKPIQRQAVLTAVCRLLPGRDAHAGRVAGLTLLDARALLHRVGGDRCFLRQLRQDLLSEYPPLHERLDAAVRAERAAEALEVCHALKGLFMGLESPRLVELARQLEAALQAGDPAAARAYLQQLGPAVELLEDALAALAPPAA